MRLLAGRRSWLVCAGVVLAGVTARSAPEARRAADDLTTTLERAGTQVEAFFARAQSLVCTETVTIQPLNSFMASEGFGRTVESELRLSWEPNGTSEGLIEAHAKRQVIKVNGRPPRPNDRNNCTTPEQEDTETQPLSMLLAQQRGGYDFTMAGTAKIDGRQATLLDFVERAQVSVDVRGVEGNDTCISYDFTGGLRGRLWLDSETWDVLRMDQRLSTSIDIKVPRPLLRRGGEPVFTLERYDTTVRFGRVTFSNPDESLLLPVSSSSMSVTRGAGTPRLRTMTKYDGYKRFMTSGRIVGN